ncbi:MULTISPECIES: alpha/beta hydrolase [Mycobacterium]|uniref:alpha/beta hydrolase n=1 Tax=Mycobacterium TaxID=1763 RepID=UPI00095FE48C|nr:MULTISPECIES: alpha/beta hydrolase [Mycobacterium]MCG7606805.1 alpha/beta hydrolase family protein [Mycobacterium sp. CnD-18-1]OLT98192.1 hypothetical protein BKG60_01780 [Mycobacterium syngnathidarum]
MSLTLQELLEWPREIQDLTGATREAATNHSNSANFYRSLTKFSSWQGEGADAAKAAMEAVAGQHDATAENLGKGAAVMDHAAEEAESVANTIKGILNDAAATPPVEINPSTNQVISPDTSYMTEEYAKQVAAKVTDLQERIAAALAAGEAVDADLASAIKTATGAEDPMPGDSRPEIHDALSKPLPEDPNQFTDLWNKLTDEEKEWLYQRDHFVGNHPGMPFVDKNRFNERHLAELTAVKQAEIDRLAREHPDWAAGGKPKTPNPNPPDYRAWKDQWNAAHRSLDGYNAVESKIDSNDGVPRLLGYIDDQGHAAISIGNPDTAQRNAVFVPGTGQDLAAISGSDGKSMDMFRAALDADPALTAKDVSVTTWMGYDRPMNVFEAGSSDPARGGAGALDTFVDGMHASHIGPPAIDTVIGHSYGSTLVGAAGSDGHHLAVDNVIAVGSPGMLVDHASDLSLDPDANVYATRARFDPINLATGWTLGPNPTTDDFGATTLEAAPGPTTGPPILRIPSIAAHSSYWDEGNPALANMGAIIAGMPPPKVVP